MTERDRLILAAAHRWVASGAWRVYPIDPQTGRPYVPRCQATREHHLIDVAWGDLWPGARIGIVGYDMDGCPTVDGAEQ